MIKDTTLELLGELQEAPSASEFDKGYRQGFARALDVLKQQADVFGISESVGLADFEYLDWVG
jgi:hypothetical protein